MLNLLNPSEHRFQHYKILHSAAGCVRVFLCIALTDLCPYCGVFCVK